MSQTAGPKSAYPAHLFRAIYSLIFPAILGTGIVSLFLSATAIVTDGGTDVWNWARFLAGISLIMIFIVSYLRSLRVSSYPDLRAGLMFLFDFILCLSMATAFGAIGFLGVIGDGGIFRDTWFSVSCYALLITFAAGYVGKALSGVWERGLILSLRLLATALCIIGSIAWQGRPFLTMAMCSMLIVMALLYGYKSEHETI